MSEDRTLSVREIVRGAALDAASLFWRLSLRTEKELSKNRVQFLYFHHVFDGEEEAFRRLMAYLAKKFEVISYVQAARRILEGKIDRPYLSISFDDGLRNNLKAAAIMEEFGIKACFFVCPSVIGEKDNEMIRTFCREKLHKPPMEFLDWRDIDGLLSKGHEIGSHTMGHSDLASLDREQLIYEIKGSYDLLESRIGKVKHFSWPFGRFENFSKEAEQLVFDSGYLTCASAVRGCHTSRAESQRCLCIRRDHIMLSWPKRHIEYFLAAGGRASSKETNYFVKE